MVKLFLKDILYVEANRSCCRPVTVHGREFMLPGSPGALERQLPPGNILRIHRSYLVNTLHVEQVVDNALLSGKKQLPLSGGYREALLACLPIIGEK